jgi:hypothetical protein
MMWFGHPGANGPVPAEAGFSIGRGREKLKGVQRSLHTFQQGGATLAWLL